MDIPAETSTLPDEEINQVIASAVGVAERKAKKGAEDAAFTRFIQQFYRGSPPEDLKARTPEALYNAAVAAWKFLQTREPGTAKIEIAPRADRQRTVILIAND